MVTIRGVKAWMCGAVAAAALACAPGSAANSKFSVRVKATPSSSFRMPDGIGSFTPAAADPRRALSFGRAGMVNNGFRFTPSSGPGSRRAVTVAVRARATTGAHVERTSNAGLAAAASALAPAAYNLGLAVGWRRFALTGDVARVEGGLLPLDRETADLGLSYSGNKWSTRLQLGAERAIGLRPHLIGADESYSVDLGGSYAIARNVDLTGGIRYRMQHDRIERQDDQRHDSQAVYIGTAFRF